MAVDQRIREELFNFAPPLPLYVDSRVLAANTAETVTVPADADLVVITHDQPVMYARKGGTAAVPVADVSDGTSSFAIRGENPIARTVERSTTFTIVSGTNGVVTFEWYARRN